MICGKSYVVGLLLLLALSLPIYSDEVCLSEEEFSELTVIFERLGKRLNEQATQIAQLEAHLTTASQRLAISQTSIETLSQTLSEAEKSYAEQARECRIKIIMTTGITALISTAVAFLVGRLL